MPEKQFDSADGMPVGGGGSDPKAPSTALLSAVTSLIALDTVDRAVLYATNTVVDPIHRAIVLGVLADFRALQ